MWYSPKFRSALVEHRSLPKRLPLTVASAPESDTDDDHPLLPTYKRKRRPNWETIEAEARQARAARVNAESAESDAVQCRQAQMSVLKEAFPDYEPAFGRKGRDPFYS